MISFWTGLKCCHLGKSKKRKIIPKLKKKKNFSLKQMKVIAGKQDSVLETLIPQIFFLKKCDLCI